MNSLIVNPNVEIINKTKWKMMLDIEKIILANGGNIFGGFVRDKIIHDSAAEIFYEYMQSIGIDSKSSEFQLKYNDITFNKDTNDRCILPSDIDCFMSTSEIKKMIEYIESKNYIVKIFRESPANLYIFKNSSDENINSLKHSKLTIKFNYNDILSDIFNMNDFVINIDIIHSDNNEVNIYDILSSNIDFECNSLIITSDNEYKLSKTLSLACNPGEKLKKIHNIINDIKLKNAITVEKYGPNNIPSYRWEKMILKGWKTTSQYFEILNGEEYDGHCLICHDNIDPLNYHIKDVCCDARFHMGCYLKMHRHKNYKSECPMCKCSSFISKTDDTLISKFAVRQGELIEDIMITPIQSNHATHTLSADMVNNIINTITNDHLSRIPITNSNNEIEYYDLIEHSRRLQLEFNRDEDDDDDRMPDLVDDFGNIIN
jgi:hypothetical protein